MRFKVSTIVAAAALIAAPIATASARDFAGSGCSGNTFLFCGNWSGVVNVGLNTLTLSVTNTSNLAPANNPASVFTQIFIGAIPAGLTAVVTETGAGTWIQDAPPSGLEGFGLVNLQFGARANPGINNGITPGQTAVLVFTFSGAAISNATFAGVQIGIHDQGVPVGTDCTSSKGVFNGTTGQNLTQPIGTCGGGGGFGTVPEPSTYALMAAGLAALGLVARRRRQNA